MFYAEAKSLLERADSVIERSHKAVAGEIGRLAIGVNELAARHPGASYTQADLADDAQTRRLAAEVLERREGADPVGIRPDESIAFTQHRVERADHADDRLLLVDEGELAKAVTGATAPAFGTKTLALDDADVTVTTYAILRLDLGQLSAREWNAVVLDEAQAIKNPESQAAKAAFAGHVPGLLVASSAAAHGPRPAPARLEPRPRRRPPAPVARLPRRRAGDPRRDRRAPSA